jgi:formate hydrogenlyase subunit 3/multisubunit Na+/H+ antiporter MnhD subunit
MSSTSNEPRTDRSPWNWLLIVPIVLPLLTTVYNIDSPRLRGFPAFYWLQFACILVGVATTGFVFRMTRTRSSSAPAAGSGSSVSSGPGVSSDE